MGGISQFFDFNQPNTSRKLFAQKRNNDGFEAPRNSLEFPMEACSSNHSIHEDIPYSCQVKRLSTKSNIYPSENSMKMMTDKNLTTGSNYQYSAPGVVARLMGMSALPSEVKPLDVKLRNNILRKEPIETISSAFKETKEDLPPSGIMRNSSQYMRNPRLMKPQPREHPQEELLQKFKKDFVAWQASKVWERSKGLELESDMLQVKDSRFIAQENLNKERMARHADIKRSSALDTEPTPHISTTKPKILVQQGGSLQHQECITKHKQLVSKDDTVPRNKTLTNDFTPLSLSRVDKKKDSSSSPTRIVILKPCFEGNNDIEESLYESSKMQDEGSMKDFLEEVKEKLRLEIQGKATTRVVESETSFSGRSTDPRQLARNMAKQIRESVAMELGETFVRSESTRSYRSEIQFNGSDSPEFFNRDTRKFLKERMKNVLKNEIEVQNPLIADGRTGNPHVTKDGIRLRPMYDFSEMGKKVRFKEDKEAPIKSKTSPFKREQQNDAAFDAEAVPPINLVRSFSAPVSGTAFGKLLLDDQHVSTGAHIRRKHEDSEHTSTEVRKNRKDSFNLKDRVSNLRQNFTLKGRLFRRKTQPLPVSDVSGFDPMELIVNAPSVLMNFGISQDNFTEVPPSPASVSSSSHDDFCRPGHPSPDSPLEVPFTDDHPSYDVSEEFISDVLETKCLSEHVEHGGTESTVLGEPFDDETIEIEGDPKAYVRSILVTAGFYKGQAFGQAFSRLDSLIRPISNWVFEKVEEDYSRNVNINEAGSFIYDATERDRRMLFDFTNEALPRVLGPPPTTSSFKKWVLSSDAMPRGGLLLDGLMRQIQIYTSPRLDESHLLDSMLAWDLRTRPWPSTSYEDIEVMGREMERVVIRELIDELVWDICS